MKQDMIEFGKYAADLVDARLDNFRIFGPDEQIKPSSRSLHSYKPSMVRTYETQLRWSIEALTGRVIDSIVSDTQKRRMLEGYVLTGRHGFFASLESLPSCY